MKKSFAQLLDFEELGEAIRRGRERRGRPTEREKERERKSKGKMGVVKQRGAAGRICVRRRSAEKKTRFGKTEEKKRGIACVKRETGGGGGGYEAAGEREEEGERANVFAWDLVGLGMCVFSCENHAQIYMLYILHE